LRLTGGDAAGLGGVEWGWDAGGGVYVVSATATISDTWVYNNTGGEEFTLGGGVFLQNSDSTLVNNAVFSNTARYGGGILTLESPAVLSHNAIMSNTVIKGGGGVALWGGACTLTGNTIRGNTAHWVGGGIPGGGIGATLINHVIADNFADVSGSGLYFDGPAQLWHTTVARNFTGGDGDGSGIYVTTGGLPISVAFTNTILAQHSVGISVTTGNTVTVNGILWYATPITVSHEAGAIVSVQNQHTGDPAFVDSNGGDYHIGATSAAIDRGVPAGILTDMDGDTRPQGSGFDLGADEFWAPMWRVYLPLVLK
jgi:parallel beta-helix repeat protein